jgi:hypothetical protein
MTLIRQKDQSFKMYENSFTEFRIMGLIPTTCRPVRCMYYMYTRSMGSSYRTCDKSDAVASRVHCSSQTTIKIAPLFYLQALWCLQRQPGMYVNI